MNERIKKLKEQATSYTWNGNYVTEELDEQKFAELIVLECANAAMDGTKEGDHYAMRIENHFDNSTGGVLHFGVEE